MLATLSFQVSLDSGNPFPALLTEWRPSEWLTNFRKISWYLMCHECVIHLSNIMVAVLWCTRLITADIGPGSLSSSVCTSSVIRVLSATTHRKLVVLWILTHPNDNYRAGANWWYSLICLGWRTITHINRACVRGSPIKSIGFLIKRLTPRHNERLQLSYFDWNMIEMLILVNIYWTTFVWTNIWRIWGIAICENILFHKIW